MSHSKIGASSMYRWSRCPGSVRLCEKAGHASTSKYAEEGTLAHEIAADILNSKDVVDVDPEMLTAIKVYTDVVAYESTGGLLFVEQKFDLSHLHPGMFGTADAVIYEPMKTLLRVYDLKYGSGIPVEVENNVQLMYYALGALYMLQEPVSDIEMVIVQPRCNHPDGPVRRWRIPFTDLLDFEADLVAAAKRTDEFDAPLVPGDHCRFCNASPICPKLHANATRLAKTEFSPVEEYSSEKLGEVLAWVPILEAWASSVREFAYREATHGRVPVGFKLVEKRAHRKWRNEAEAIENFRMLGLEESEIFKSTLKSPAQIEAILKAPDLIKTLAVAESSGLNLVPDSDKRKPIKLDAKTEFAIVSKE